MLIDLTALGPELASLFILYTVQGLTYFPSALYLTETQMSCRGISAYCT